MKTLYTTATKAEFSGDLDKAFKLYIKAAEQFLHLGTTTSNVASRDKCKSEAAKCLDRAEKIRKRKKDVAPVARDPFSERRLHCHSERWQCLELVMQVNRPLFCTDRPL